MLFQDELDVEEEEKVCVPWDIAALVSGVTQKLPLLCHETGH